MMVIGFLLVPFCAEGSISSYKIIVALWWLKVSSQTIYGQYQWDTGKGTLMVHKKLKINAEVKHEKTTGTQIQERAKLNSRSGRT